jgi:hypothetical protein
LYAVLTGTSISIDCSTLGIVISLPRTTRREGFSPGRVSEPKRL